MSSPTRRPAQVLQTRRMNILTKRQPVEALPDCTSLAQWLAAAGLIPKSHERSLKDQWCLPIYTEAIREFWTLRENLRKAVCHIEAGESPSSDFLAILNRMLQEHPYVEQVVRAASGKHERIRVLPEVPEDAFAPIAHAIAQLLTNTTRSRIRKCQGCELHFYDRSKTNLRIWCSIRRCGARSKAATYRRKKRLPT